MSTCCLLIIVIVKDILVNVVMVQHMYDSAMDQPRKIQNDIVDFDVFPELPPRFSRADVANKARISDRLKGPTCRLRRDPVLY